MYKENEEEHRRKEREGIRTEKKSEGKEERSCWLLNYYYKKQKTKSAGWVIYFFSLTSSLHVNKMRKGRRKFGVGREEKSSFSQEKKEKNRLFLDFII